MKLLIITQIVDTQDPILGFFHRWISTFAAHSEQVTVICLKEGTHNLPANVRVMSLGKEVGASRLTYLRRLYTYSWKERHAYDAVFVHMNPEYIVLVGLLWRMLGKTVGMWYAHGAVTLKLHLATLFTQLVFSSTPEGFRVRSSKTHIVGQGIDCTHFVRQAVGDVTKAVTVGRISRSKHLHVLVNTIALVRERGRALSLDIYGSEMTDADIVYRKELVALIEQHELNDTVRFVGAVSQENLPDALCEYGLFLNAGQTGSLDKTILEASATGRIVLSSNPGTRSFLDAVDTRLAPQNTKEAFADTIEYILGHSDDELSTLSRQLRQQVEENHSLPSLITKIMSAYS